MKNRVIELTLQTRVAYGLKFYVPGQPVAQGSMLGHIVRGKRGGYVAKSRQPPKLRNWRHQVAWRCWEAMKAEGLLLEPLEDGPVELYVIAFSVKPQRPHPKRKYLPATRPDLDKILRAVGDALTGVFYKDDSQVVNAMCFKRYGERAGLEVHVHAIDPDIDPLHPDQVKPDAA